MILDTKNKIACEIKYNPNYNSNMSGTLYRHTLGWIPGLNGLGTNAKAQRPARSDDIHLEIFKNADTKKTLACEGNGSWLSHIEIDGKVVWKIEDPLPKWKAEGSLSDDIKMLPSDTIHRLDYPLIRAKEDFEAAEAAKIKLEEAQRADKKLRVAAAEKRKK